jgi:hypothetical protein
MSSASSARLCAWVSLRERSDIGSLRDSALPGFLSLSVRFLSGWPSCIGADR